MQVSYFDENSKKLLTVESCDEVCKPIAEGKKDIYYLAEKMQILYCDNNIEQV